RPRTEATRIHMAAAATRPDLATHPGRPALVDRTRRQPAQCRLFHRNRLVSLRGGAGLDGVPRCGLARVSLLWIEPENHLSIHNADDRAPHGAVRFRPAVLPRDVGPQRQLAAVCNGLTDGVCRNIDALRGVGVEEEDEAARATRLEMDLRNALERDEIEVLFQPQVGVTSGAVIGAEALARWRHPAYGELGAATLFAAADRSDHLVELSEHIQRKAAAEAARWPAALDALRLAINVTAADIARPDFVARFAAIVDDSGLARGRVTVEVTESGLIADLGGAADILAELRAGGFRVAIDDFGTGYSSLAYLKSLPLDYLKIDKRLSGDIEGSPRDRIVVRGVIEMARSLGLTVIAEGVESEAQLALLAEEGCAIYQGYLCSPPVGAEELTGLVER
ncbi:MAG: EAL domain-containing protein, partial [Sphingomonadaceae bacterium]|nr:EAL domain-containing protein [Sphingomonadaceae bacterium]